MELLIILLISFPLSMSLHCDQPLPHDVIPPPTIPVTYSYWANAQFDDIIKGSNETILLNFVSHPMANPFTYYEMIRGRGNDTSYKSSVYIDYKNNQVFYVDHDLQKCDVSQNTKPNTLDSSIFTTELNRGLKNLKHLYNWNYALNYTAGGEHFVDRVPVNHYKTCMLFENNTMKYDVDLFVGKYGWEFPSVQAVPVKLKISSSMETDEGVKQINVTFKFSFFGKGPMDSGNYPSSPHGMECPGRNDIPRLPEFSGTYSYTQEVLNSDLKVIYNDRIWYNFDDRLYRKTGILPQQNTTDPRNLPITTHNHSNNIRVDRSVIHLSAFGQRKEEEEETRIHDFREGVIYYINNAFGQCVTRVINSSTPFTFDIQVVENDTTQFQMLDPVLFMQRLNLKYMGRVTRMHHHKTPLEMDVWSSEPHAGKTPGLKMNFTYMYTTDDWSTLDGISPVLLAAKVEIYGILNGIFPIDKTYNIRYSDISYQPDYSGKVFDVSPCHVGKERKTVCLKFSRQSNVFAKSYPFTSGLRSAVADAANISMSRISSNIVMQSDEAEQFIYTWITLFEVPAIHGNTAEYEKQISLAKAMELLRKVVSNNQLTVIYGDDMNYPVTVTAYSNYYVTTEEFYAGTVLEHHLSDGSIVGLAFGMLILGVLIGFGIVYILKVKQSNAGQFAYTTQT